MTTQQWAASMPWTNGVMNAALTGWSGCKDAGSWLRIGPRKYCVALTQTSWWVIRVISAITITAKLSAGKKATATPTPNATERPTTAAAVASRMQTVMLTTATSTFRHVSAHAADGSDVIGLKLPCHAVTTANRYTAHTTAKPASSRTPVIASAAYCAPSSPRRLVPRASTRRMVPLPYSIETSREPTISSTMPEHVVNTCSTPER